MNVINTSELRNLNAGRRIQCAWGNCKATFADNWAGKSAFGWHHILMHCGPGHNYSGKYRYIK